MRNEPIDVVRLTNSHILKQIVIRIQILFVQSLIIEVFKLSVVNLALRYIEILREYLQRLCKEVQPTNKIDMLLRQLLTILPGVVIQPTAHEIPILTRVLTPPPELYLLVYLLHIRQIKVRLSCLKIPKPLLQLPHALLQQCPQSRVVRIMLYQIPYW